MSLVGYDEEPFLLGVCFVLFHFSILNVYILVFLYLPTKGLHYNLKVWL